MTVAALMLGAPAVPGAEATADELKIVHVAVGKGDGAICQGPCGETAIIDTPESRAGDMAAALDAHAGTRTLSWVNVSHYHSDHMGGIAELATAHGVSIPVLYDRGGGSDAYDSQQYRDYDAWASASTDRRTARIGDRFTLCSGDQEVTFEVLSVGIDGTAAGGTAVTHENDKSVCLRVTYRAFVQATCGDLSGVDGGGRTDMESVVAPEMGEVHVARVNNHGSANASNATWVTALDADHAVISVGWNDSGHPHPEVISRWESSGTTVWQTHRGGPRAEGGNDLADGDVVITTSGEQSYTITGTASGRSATGELAETRDDEPGTPGEAPSLVSEGEVVRVEGANRFAPGASAAARLWPDGAPTVVLATGLGYPDALAGGPVAAVHDAPLLMATRDELPSVVRRELERLAPSRVILLGGTAALSTRLEDEVSGLPSRPRVDRIAGSQRFETAERAASAAGRTGEGDVVVATGQDYPDALAAGALTAGAAAVPLTLATRDQLMTSLQPQERAHLIGGHEVLTVQVEEQAHEQAGSVLRHAGATRFATSQAVATFALEERLTGEVPLIVATGQDYPDALFPARMPPRHTTAATRPPPKRCGAAGGCRGPCADAGPARLAGTSARRRTRRRGRAPETSAPAVRTGRTAAGRRSRCGTRAPARPRRSPPSCPWRG
jgi:beta-lactamase superfamily II metal-dependent hydrolase/putative cell wall-binding protein